MADVEGSGFRSPDHNIKLTGSLAGIAISQGGVDLQNM
jgi:hypothetical protein